MKIGLFKGRHKMPKFLKDYIFGREYDLSDFVGMRRIIGKKIPANTYKVELYCTGATTAIVEVIKYCTENNIALTLMHFNKDCNGYIRQDI